MRKNDAPAPATTRNTKDFLPIEGTDYVELHVSNALQAAHYYKSAFGFQDGAYAGLETGRKETCSYVLFQDKIRLVLTSPLHSGTKVGTHIDFHGDGVKVIALRVPDAKKAFEETVKRGAEAIEQPTTYEDKDGSVCCASIKTYGDTIHRFVERTDYRGVFLPGFQAFQSAYTPSQVGLKYIDHMVGNVPLGEMNRWVRFYKDVMGFSQLISFDDKDISTEYTALMSKVMSNGNGRIKFPINEPAEGRRRSQIEEYLDFYESAGVQHIAVATDDIVRTVGELMRRGVAFLDIPKTYYEEVGGRVGKIDEEIEVLSTHNILVDRDEDGYLLQIFTKPVSPRPTLFFEIIQRKGAQSFGKGNFKALFEAIEREQAHRGTL